MDRLKFSTRESLYPPLEIEIDGIVYKHRKLTHEFRAELSNIDVRVGAKDESGVTDWIIAMFGVKPEILAALDVREAEDIYVDITAKLQEIEKERIKKASGRFGVEEKKDPPQQPVKTIPGKNAKRPGEKK